MDQPLNDSYSGTVQNSVVYGEENAGDSSLARP